MVEEIDIESSSAREKKSRFQIWLGTYGSDYCEAMIS